MKIIMPTVYDSLTNKTTGQVVVSSLGQSIEFNFEGRTIEINKRELKAALEAFDIVHPQRYI